MVMGEKELGDLGPLALGELGQRVGDRVRVDEDARAAWIVEDEVGVGEAVGRFGAGQEQAVVLLS